MELKTDMIFLGQSGFLMKHEGKSIYIDPFMIGNDLPKADLILITHAHQDHYSPVDIDKIIKKDTKIIASKLCQGIEKYQNVTILKPFDSISELGIKLETTRAYNTNAKRLNWHPKANDWLGYIISIDGKRIYHAGDTDFIEEMKALKNLDLAILPMGGTYTMEVDEMIEAAKAIDTKNVAPMHYKRLLGDKAEAAENKLKNSLKNVVMFKEMGGFS